MSSAICATCEPGAICFLGAAEVAKLTGLDEDGIARALRAGGLPMPTARGIHGERLWAVRELAGVVGRRDAQESRR